MMELLKAIHIEQFKIDEELATEDKQVQFYRKFLKNNFLGSIESAAKADSCDLAIALIVKNKPDLDIEQVQRAVYGNRKIFEKVTAEDIEGVINLIAAIHNDGITESVKEILQNGTSPFLSIFKKEGKAAAAIELSAVALGCTIEDFIAFMDLYISENEQTHNALAVINALREIEKERATYHESLEQDLAKFGIKVKAKDSRRFVSDQIKSSWDIPLIHKVLKEVTDYGQKKDSEDKNRKRHLKKKKCIYEKLEKNINRAVQGGEIRNIDSIIGDIKDPDIRMQILKVIYLHNKAIYDVMSSEYETLSANDSSRYQVLLAKYGISPESYEVGSIMNNSIEDTEKMLQQLVNLKFTVPKDLLKILQESNLETTSNIITLTERGIVTRTLLSNHKNVFNPTSKEYELFMRNLAIFQEKQINPRYLSTNDHIFTTTPQRLRQSIKTLEKYELTSMMKVGMDCSFLAKPDLAPAIDTLLELGYEKNLLENLELLNYKDKFDRLRVLKALNVPVTTTEGLLEVLTTDKFIMPDNVIENYIYNAVDYNIPSNIIISKEPKKKVSDITRLNDFSYTSRTYSFDGILISKNKVHRNLSTVDTATNVSDRLLYSVIKGSTLTDEELETIHSSLTQKKSTNKTNKKQ